MKYISRTIEKRLNEMIDSYQVIMITGPRQVGKTTLLNYITKKSVEKINYVTFDDVKLRMQAIEDPELFLRTHEAPLIIDEFQYAPELLSYIKIIVDREKQEAIFNEDKEIKTLYYLTGSQIFQTMEDISESLSGRVGIIDLYALSTREIQQIDEVPFIPNINDLKIKPRTKSFSVLQLYERILKGSYPELYNSEKNIEQYYNDYIRTYMERDVRKIENIKDENKFIRFVSAIAARTGQEFVTSNVATDIGIDDKTADGWLSILKNTGLVYLLQPYMNNSLGRVVKRPKVYFMDTGLACYLVGYTDAKTLERSAYNGAIFETYVVSEIIKSYANYCKDSRKHLYYYRDSSKREIDLLVVDNDKIYPVEIKKSANPGKDAIKNFGVVNSFEKEVINGIVLCMCSEIMAIDDKNYLVPIEYL